MKRKLESNLIYEEKVNVNIYSFYILAMKITLTETFAMIEC